MKPKRGIIISDWSSIDSIPIKACATKCLQTCVADTKPIGPITIRVETNVDIVRSLSEVKQVARSSLSIHPDLA